MASWSMGAFQNSDTACCMVLPPTAISFHTPVTGRLILPAAWGVVPKLSSKSAGSDNAPLTIRQLTDKNKHIPRRVAIATMRQRTDKHKAHRC